MEAENAELIKQLSALESQVGSLSKSLKSLEVVHEETVGQLDTETKAKSAALTKVCSSSLFT